MGVFIKQHALKGQKLIAQGNALGIMAISNAPCKGKSFTNCPWSFKAFALTGRQVCEHDNPQGVALGYELLPLQGVLLV